MKKHLKEELIVLAEKIIQLKQQEQIQTKELKNLAQKLYEKLSILNFTEENLVAAGTTKIEKSSSTKIEVPEIKEQQEDEYDEYAPDGTQFNDDDSITEPNTEKIKDIVAQMPPETQRVDEIMKNLAQSREKNMEDMGGVHHDHLPQFEPAKPTNKEAEKPKSLNDRLKKSIQVGVNDRHAFIKHLFNGSTADYNRVLSQLNTIKSREEGLDFVLNLVKPDYNNWEGKDIYEARFLALVENKFE